MSRFKTLDDLPEDLTGKKVIVRVDLNVPMEGARVTDDTRLRAMLPTVLELSDRGAIVLLLSHVGRPKGDVRPDMSTAQLVLPLHRLAGRSVRFIEDCQGPEAERAVTTMLPGNIGILDYTDEPVVSIDLMHTSASSTVDSLETAVLEGKLVRVVSWYDNEWGFSNRMVDTAAAMAALG